MLGSCAVLPSVAATAAPPSASATGQPVGEPLGEYGDAAREAEATGTPVEVASQTTETTQVLAQPDGTFTLDSHTAAVRVKRNGSWHAIDTTLHRNADGSVSPSSTAMDVSFSGGGDQALLTLAHGADSVELHWPSTLPAPTVSGDTATYADVLPGVDLRLIAYPEGYREVLVVRNAEAAANPALRTLRLDTVARGLSLQSDADGGIAAVGADGAPVFSGPAPVMWDSAPERLQGGRGSARSANGHVNRLPLAVTAADGRHGTGRGHLTLTPADAALTGPDVQYPVFIDPSMSNSRNDGLSGDHYLTVHSGGWDYFDDSTEVMRVGYCGWSGCTSVQGKSRSYFGLNVAALTGKPTAAHVYSATVYALQKHQAANCSTPEPTDLWSAGSFSSSTNWGGPRTAKLDSDSKAYSEDCGTGNLIFNNANVVDYVQSAASSDTKVLNFNLSAPDESNAYQWKKFGNDPSITVSFDFPPSVPANLDLAASVDCSGKPRYTRDQTPTVYASAIDYNPNPGNVGLLYQIYTNPAGSSAVRYNPTAVSAPSNTKTAWTTNSSNTNSTAAMADDAYALRVKAVSLSPDTADQSSGYTGWYYFTIDHVAPAAPTISSFDYPQGSWGAPQGTPGQITFAGASDVAAFTYSFDTSGGEPLPTDTTCAYTTTPTKTGGMVTATSGKGSVTLPTTLTPGYHTVYAKAFDGAHNTSGQSAAYVFYVAPTFPGEGATQHEAEAITPTQPEGQGDPAFNFGAGYPVYSEGTSAIWSAGAQSHLVATAGTPETPARFTYGFDVPLSAYYGLGVQVTLANHYGILTFELDGRPVSLNGQEVSVDTYSATTATKYVDLGGAMLLPGPHKLTVKVVGANASSGDYVYNGTYGGVAISSLHDHGRSAGIDFFNVVPVNNVTFGSFAASFNNNGITSDGTAGDFGPSSSDSALSLQAMTQAGFGPGARPVVDGVTFTMPAQNADGTDNTMAGGQTLPLPTDANGNYPVASAVDLLVASTCGTTPTGASIQLSMNHIDPANPDGDLMITDTPIHAVPDWLNGTTPVGDTQVTLAVRLPYYDTGTTTSTAKQPALYHLRVPVKPGYEDKPIKSITLPSLGSNFTQACTTPTLHVFAITTS
ncbi:hypothetical protein GCM10009798_13690 [Nocardioides panacihumi]|uniref:PA14 domain-containing protein n=1 Tax=Nocardioides panacihumi TaxID=400774 RepID=A0ABN2QPC4_9ACTN